MTYTPSQLQTIARRVARKYTDARARRSIHGLLWLLDVKPNAAPVLVVSWCHGAPLLRQTTQATYVL